MASRVNTKFVVLLSAVIVLLVAGFGGVYYFKVLKSPQEMIREGDMYMAKDQPRLAVRDYGRALSQRPKDVALIRKYIHTLQQIPVKDIVQARQYRNQIISLSRTASELRPQDPELLENFYGRLLSLAQQPGGRGMYDQLYRLSNGKLNHYPNNLIAHKYRGIAQVHRLRTDMPRDQQRQADKDLLTFYKHDPGDARVAHNLALWSLWEAHRLEQGGGELEKTRQRAQKLRRQALELSQRSLARKPDDLQRKLDHLRILLDPAINKTQQANSLVRHLEARLIRRPQPADAVTTLATRLMQIDQRLVPRKNLPDTTRGAQRAQHLLEAAVAKKPDSLRYRYRLGQVLAQQREVNHAVEQFRKAWKMGVHATALKALENYQLRFAARLTQLKLQVDQADQLHNGKKQQARLAKIEQALSEVEDTVGHTGSTNLIRGKIALVRHHYGTAMQKLDKASEQLGEANPEALLLSARARGLAGQRGAEVEQLQKAVRLMPGQAGVRLELARVQIQLDQTDRALANIKKVLDTEPSNLDARVLQARLQGRAGHNDQAIATLEKLDPPRHPQVLLTLARVYMRAGKQDKARELLEQRFARHPDDVRLLTTLLHLEPSDKRRRKLIQSARQAGASPAVLGLLQTASQAKPGSAKQVIQKLINQQKNPLKREMMQARLYNKTGDRGKTLQALQRAAKIAPNNPRVIAMRFAAALDAQQWDQADKLAQRAASLNLDLAGGAFFRGRLAAARGRLDEAVAEYRRGLSTRPVYSMGWQRLGDARLRNHNLEAAENAYRRAVDQRPDNARALRGLATVADSRGNHDRALKLFKQALEHDRGNKGLLKLYLAYEQQYGSVKKALQLRRELAKAAPGDVSNRRALAMLLAAQNQTKEAVRTVEGLIEDQGRSRENVAALASVYAKANQPDKGHKVLEGYVDSRGDKADVRDYLTLAHFELATGKGKDALNTYQQARRMENPKHPLATRELAQLLLRHGMSERATDLYRQLYKQQPHDQGVALDLAQALLASGKPAEARKLTTQYPHTSKAMWIKGLAALRQNQHDQGVRALNQAVELNGRNTAAMLALAKTLAQDTDRVGRARQLLNKAISVDPGDTRARLALADLHLRLNETPEAVSELQTLLRRQPDNTAGRIKLVNVYLGRGDIDSAKSLVSEAAKRQPDNPTWPRVLSQLARRTGDTASAIAHARKTVKLAPTPADVATLTALLIQADQAPKALEVLKNRIELVNRQPLLQGLRGRALAAAGKKDQARRVFAKAVTRAASVQQTTAVADQMAAAWDASEAIEQLASFKQPSHPLWVQLALAKLEMDNRQFGQAAHRLRGVADRVPTADKALRIRHHAMLAQCLQATGGYKQARKLYQQVLELDPTNVGTLNNLAYLLVENLNQPEQGLSIARRAAKQAPADPQVLDTLGWAQFKASKVKQARQTLEDSVGSHPLAPSCYHLAAVYHKLGMIGQAHDSAERAIRLAKNSHDAQMLRQSQDLLGRLKE